jgi:dinuclear metal center YbgI/SA1388 family protein
MIEPEALANYCSTLLDAARFSDYAPNGLQLQGSRPVSSLITGVTASAALIEAARAHDADALLVHHGWFWKGEPPMLVGTKGRRVRALMEIGASLLAYHLPLDAHPQYGNNAALARVLDIGEPAPSEIGPGLVWTGRLAEPASARDWAAMVGDRLARAPTLIEGDRERIESVAWCTGGGQGYIEQAAALGVDAFLSGEISEQTTHAARELGICYLAAGHHATERYGVQALGNHLATRFGLKHQFVDIDNPA